MDRDTDILRPSLGGHALRCGQQVGLPGLDLVYASQPRRPCQADPQSIGSLPTRVVHTEDT